MADESTEYTQQAAGNGPQAQKKRQPVKYKTDDIIAALKACGGMVHVAARKLHCDPKTIYKRARKSQAIQDTITEEREYLADLAETALKSAVLMGEPWAVTTVLFKTEAGRKRGFGDKSTSAVNLNIDWNSLSEEQLQRIANGEDVVSVLGDKL